MERSDTPCVEGFADSVLSRRNRERPGTCFSAAFELWHGT